MAESIHLCRCDRGPHFDSGALVTPHNVERGAAAFYEADDTYRDTWESQPEPGVQDWYRKMARIVLRTLDS